MQVLGCVVRSSFDQKNDENDDTNDDKTDDCTDEPVLFVLPPELSPESGCGPLKVTCLNFEIMCSFYKIIDSISTIDNLTHVGFHDVTDFIDLATSLSELVGFRIMGVKLDFITEHASEGTVELSFTGGVPQAATHAHELIPKIGNTRKSNAGTNIIYIIAHDQHGEPVGISMVVEEHVAKSVTLPVVSFRELFKNLPGHLGGISRRGKVFAKLVLDTEAKDLIPIITKKVKAGSRICSDTYRSYTGLAAMGYVHKDGGT